MCGDENILLKVQGTKSSAMIFKRNVSKVKLLLKQRHLFKLLLVDRLLLTVKLGRNSRNTAKSFLKVKSRRVTKFPFGVTYFVTLKDVLFPGSRSRKKRVDGTPVLKTLSKHCGLGALQCGWVCCDELPLVGSALYLNTTVSCLKLSSGI